MFWDKGYTPSQNIEALLEKENATVEEFLDDEDLLQECKTLKKSIIKYFTRPDVIKRLVEIITTEPSEELPLAQRFRHANMACEILTLGLPSLNEKLLADPDTLKILYSYLENEPPLNPLLSSFFHKTFCMLITKKLEQDWFLYQQMCLQLLEYLKSRKNFLDLIFNHFATPVIPELILQLLKDFEGGQLKRNLYEWLTEEKIVERLIAILGNPEECDKHSNVTEFLCDLIKQGRTMRQSGQENDSFEPAFDGSNPILKTIESEASIEALLNVILEPNAQESAIVSGISVVLTLIKLNTITDEFYSDRLKFIQNREREIHEQIETTVIRVMAPRLNELNQLLKTPPLMPPIKTSAAKLEPPFGNTRLQVCRVFTVLLQTKNEEISKAICETDFFETLLELFKQYCWNNFLHSEVEKCMKIIFETNTFNNNNNSAQGSTIANDGSISKSSNNGDSNGINSSNFFDCVITNGVGDGENNGDNAMEPNPNTKSSLVDNVDNVDKDENDDNKNIEIKDEAENSSSSKTEDDSIAATELDVDAIETAAVNNIKESVHESGENDNVVADEANTAASSDENSVDMNEFAGSEVKNDVDSTSKNFVEEEKMLDSNEENSFKEKENLKNSTDIGPSAIQKHLIVHCKLIHKLIDCWQHNHDMETAEKGRRLGYMGYLIKTLRHITNCISESEHIGALIESNLSDESETEKWQSITNAKDGDLTKALATQNRLLANCNAHEACDFGNLPKDFLSDTSTWDYIMSSNMFFTDSSFIKSKYDAVLTFVDDDPSNGLNIFQSDNLFDLDDDEDDDELAGAVGGIGSSSLGLGTDNGLSFFGKNTKSSALPSLGVNSGICSNPWYDFDPFAHLKATGNGVSNNTNTSNTNTNTNTNTSGSVNTNPTSAGPWCSDFDSCNDFADFESHFNAFASDLVESLTMPKDSDVAPTSDNSANVGVGGVGGVGVIGEDLHSGKQIHSPTDIGSDTKDCHEYDNNANVEKLPTALDDGTARTTRNSLDIDIGKDDEDAVPPSLVRTLQSVMQESEDDYEDDEGMWTKPLGQSGNDETCDVDADVIDKNLKHTKDTTLVNGANAQIFQEQWLVQNRTKGDHNDIETEQIPSNALKSAVIDANKDVDMTHVAMDIKKPNTVNELDDTRASSTTS